jgi:hypothetical protein
VVIDLPDLLDGRARLIEPSLDAFSRVMGTVRRRHRRRQALAWSAAVCVLAGALTSIALPRATSGRRPDLALSGQLLGTRQALFVRRELGVHGPTKGAPESVIVSDRSPTGGVEISLVDVSTGQSTRVGVQGDANQATVSPKGDVLAAVSRRGVIVAYRGKRIRPAVIPGTEGAEGQVSWDGTGSALFARVKGQWVRVSNAAGISGAEATRPHVQQVTVPTVPGGPILLSVSPGGGVATLFGITYPKGQPPLPHLYVGRFDGMAVSAAEEVEIPRGALEGPMGWVGDNAFLLAPEPGKAMLVRTDGSKIQVFPQDIADPCQALSARIGCASDGPRLLGTNADGSLLFWRISAKPARDRSSPPILVLHYKTWLDGTNGLRLSGLVGRLGPPVAPR